MCKLDSLRRRHGQTEGVISPNIQTGRRRVAAPQVIRTTGAYSGRIGPGGGKGRKAPPEYLVPSR